MDKFEIRPFRPRGFVRDVPAIYVNDQELGALIVEHLKCEQYLPIDAALMHSPCELLLGRWFGIPEMATIDAEDEPDFEGRVPVLSCGGCGFPSCDSISVIVEILGEVVRWRGWRRSFHIPLDNIPVLEFGREAYEQVVGQSGDKPELNS